MVVDCRVTLPFSGALLFFCHDAPLFARLGAGHLAANNDVRIVAAVEFCLRRCALYIGRYNSVWDAVPGLVGREALRAFSDVVLEST